MTQTAIKIQQDDRKLLALYKLQNDLPSYSVAIRHAIEEAEKNEFND